MRIVGGRLRGRAIAGPESGDIRPTSDRLREAIFNILAHGYDDLVSGARVMDLFAGTGAMGLEALSRGALFTLFVDDGAQARGLIRENIEALGLGGNSRIFRRDATNLGKADRFEPADIVFCDPPYGKDLAPRALASPSPQATTFTHLSGSIVCAGKGGSRSQPRGPMQRFSLPPLAAGRAGWGAFMEMGWLENLIDHRPVAHFDRRLARFWTTPHPDPPRRKRGEGEEPTPSYSMRMPLIGASVSWPTKEPSFSRARRRA
jgi:16S rRNA (guanine966-N2)-methyltransferase